MPAEALTTLAARLSLGLWAWVSRATTDSRGGGPGSESSWLQPDPGLRAAAQVAAA